MADSIAKAASDDAALAVAGASLEAGRAAAKARLAVGVFPHPERAAEALIDLACEGVGGRDVCLFAHARALQAFMQAVARDEGGPATRYACWVSCQPASGARPWTFDLVAGAQEAQDWPIAPHEALEVVAQHRALARHAEQLNERLRGGGGVVVVHSSDDRQLQSVCGVLLRHSAAHVQTHDLRLPRAGRARA